MLGAVPAVFTPGPPPAHMSSPGRPVAPKRGQGLIELLPVPVRPLNRAAEARNDGAVPEAGGTVAPR